MVRECLENLTRDELMDRIHQLEEECATLRKSHVPIMKEEQLIGSAADCISEAIVIYDQNGGLVAWNKNFAELYHYKPEELQVGVHYSELGRIDIERGNVAVGDEFGGGEEYLRRKAEYRRKLEGSFIVHLKDGRWIKTTDRPMGDGGFVSVQVDITEHKKMEEHMRYMAQHDMLTQSANRNLFVEKSNYVLASAKRHDEKFALLFIDIDGFKGVNDTLGHGVGDEALRLIAERMKARLRESDLFARIGGDEFVVLLPHQYDKVTAQKVASDLIEQMSKPFYLQATQVMLGMSVGIAHFPDHGDTIDMILHKADQAMYQAKDAGKNQWVEAK